MSRGQRALPGLREAARPFFAARGPPDPPCLQRKPHASAALRPPEHHSSRARKMNCRATTNLTSTSATRSSGLAAPACTSQRCARPGPQATARRASRPVRPTSTQLPRSPLLARTLQWCSAPSSTARAPCGTMHTLCHAQRSIRVAEPAMRQAQCRQRQGRPTAGQQATRVVSWAENSAARRCRHRRLLPGAAQRRTNAGDATPQRRPS